MKLLTRFFALAFCFATVFPTALPAQQTAAEHGIAVSHMERSVNPGDDFYRYANGEWLNKTELPPDRGSIGVFSILDDTANKRTAGIIEEAAKSNGKPGSNERKIADLYNSYMDEKAIEAVRQYKFKPAMKDGKPVKVDLYIDVNFQIF